MKRLLAPLTLCLLLVAQGALSQTPTQTSAQQGAAPQQPGLTPVVPPDEVKILQAQLQQMRDTDQRLLSTVYWSLGTLAVMAALLVGFNWYVNFRQYERDQLWLARQVTERVTEAILLKFDEARKTLVKEMAEREADLETGMRESADALRTDLLRLQYTQVGMEADRWTKEEVYVNSFQILRDQLRIAIQLRDSFYLNNALERIEACLGRILTRKESYVKSHEVNEVIALLEKLPVELKLNVKRLGELLEQVARMPTGYHSDF